jgi:hypothetical protein
VRRSFAVLAALLGLVAGCDQHPYKLKNGRWHFEKQPLDVPVGENLTPLNRRFAKTKSRAYYRDMPIEGAQAASFQALDEHYAKDAVSAFWFNTYRESSDYFTTLRIRQIRIEGADPASFAALTQDYARDAARIYHEGAPFRVEDPASFQVLDYGYARDNRRGYYTQTPIEGSDGASFSVVTAHYAKDAERAYYSDFKPRRGNESRVTIETKVIATGAEAASLTDVDMGYAKTATRVFHRGEVVEGADPASFAADRESDVDARDKTGSYKDGKRVAAP